VLRCILCFYASRRYRKLLCYYMAVNRAVPIELFYHYCSIRTHVPSQNKIHLYTHTFKNELGYFHGQTCLDFEKEKKMDFNKQTTGETTVPENTIHV